LTKTEAHERLGSANIYWHEPEHCWKTKPRRRHLTQKVREKPVHRAAARRARPETAHRIEPKVAHRVEPKIVHGLEKTAHQDQPRDDHPKWHDAMSAMLAFQAQPAPPRSDRPKSQDPMTGWLPEQEPVPTPWVDRWVNIVPLQLPVAARWVNIVQVAPPPIIKAESESEPMGTSRVVLMVMVAVMLTLAIGEFLFIGMGLAGYPYRRRH
jgi:hypothetical protein